MKSVEGKVAIITGGASGIGRKMVDVFAEEGAIVIAADVNEKALEEVNELENVESVKLDISSDEEWKRVVEQIIEKHGKIDILLNNAGISSEKSIGETTIDDWNLMLKINGFGPFLGMKYVIPEMVKQGKGSVVNSSSYTAKVGMGLNAYTASKGAVRSISKAAATEYGHAGVRVNAIFPGVIETPMTQTLQSSQDVVKQLIAMTPLQRLGQPEDIAKAALFLASDDAAYITGAELTIDGGFTAR